MQHIQPKLQERLETLSSTGLVLYVSTVTGDSLWSMYLSSFKPEHNPVYRCPESSEHNCTLCSNFIRRYGNIVAISPDFEVLTLWDIEVTDEYAASFAAMSTALRAAAVRDVFKESYEELKSLPYESTNKTQEMYRLGFLSNVKVYSKEEAEKYPLAGIKPNQVKTFHHLSVALPRTHVVFNESVAAYQNRYRSIKEVFQRGLETISMDTLTLVKDLISQRSLLNGETYVPVVERFMELLDCYCLVPLELQDLWLWRQVVTTPTPENSLYGFRNTLIGTLCVELSEGKDLIKACEDWNKRVDPENYKRAVAPFTEAQRKKAQEAIDDGGYTKAFERRFATIDDISASEILHLNSGTDSLPVAKLLDTVKAAPASRHKRQEFDKVETVGIEKFMKDILPGCTRVQAYLESRFKGNLVTMTTAKEKGTKSAFAWGNNFSWTYEGNLAGKSMIQQLVKEAGGKVDAPVRMSLMWNNDPKNPNDNSDLDLWCNEPSGSRIGFNTGFRKDNSATAFSPNGGQLDVDVINPNGKPAVENIYYKSISGMKDGVYMFYVHPYFQRDSKGFEAELKIEDQLFQYAYPKRVTESVVIAKISVTNGKVVHIEHKLQPNNSEGVVENLYGLDTLSFHDVSLVCHSPNHWNTATGHKHYFFMLKNCKADKPLKSFHCENLNADLLPHRRVLEGLSSVLMLQPDESKQLSGLGFNATVPDTLILKLEGSHKRVIKIQF